MSFVEWLHRKADENAHNEILAFLMIILGMTWRSIWFKVGVDHPNMPVGGLFMFSGFLFIVGFGFFGLAWIAVMVASFAMGVLFHLGRSGADTITEGRPRQRWIVPPPMPTFSDLPPPPKRY